MPRSLSTPRSQLLPGVAVALVYLVVALTCMLASTGPEHLLTASPTSTRNIGLVPYVAVALCLLAVALLARRWWLTPVVSLLLVGGGFWWQTWLMNLPRRMAQGELSAAQAQSSADDRGLTWAVVASLLVVGGWSVARRDGWSWTIGLIPSAIVAAVAAAADQALRPDSQIDTSAGLEAAVRSYSQEIRTSQAIAIVLALLAGVAGVWFCAYADRLLRSARAAPSSPVADQHAEQTPASVADELRKLVELRDSGELTVAEFEALRSRLLV